MTPRAGRVRLALRSLLFIAGAYAFIWVSGFPRHYDDEELPSQRPSPDEVPYPVNDDHIVVSVMVEAADAWTTVPQVVLLTDGQYHDTLLFMGDMRMDVGRFYLHDLMDRYDRHFVTENQELERYRRQYEYAQASVDLRRLRERDPVKEKEIQATLDKYKILRVVERAWETRPRRPWYVFIRSDTYLARPNLQSFLGQYDPQEPMFFANPPLPSLGDMMGGNTFILSEAAMQALLEDRKDVIHDYNPRLSEHVSAYDVLSTVLATELSLGPNQTWPSMSGFNPATIPFGPGIWCDAVLAMHSVPIELASDVYRFQHEKGGDPLLFADLWIRFMQPEDLEAPRDDWDNLSSGLQYSQWNILSEGAAHVQPRNQHHHHKIIVGAKASSGEASWEACQKSCEDNEHCIQWSYSSLATQNYNENGMTKCHMSRTMRFGSHVEPQKVGEDTLKWRSGWRKGKFQQWARQQRCKHQRG